MIRHNGITIDRRRRAISHRGTEILFCLHTRRSVQFNLMCHLILAGPCSADELFDLLYQDDEDGGPINGRNIVDIYLATLKPRYDALSLQRRNLRHNSRTLHWLEPA